MRLAFPASTSTAAAEALRLCHAAFPAFPLPAETVSLFLSELEKPGAAKAAAELALELDLFPSIGQIRRRAGQLAAAPNDAAPCTGKPAPRCEPPPLGWGAKVSEWLRAGARGAAPAFTRRE